MIIAGRFDDDSIGGLQSISWELKENQIAAMLVSNSMKDEILLLKYQQLWLSWRIVEFVTVLRLDSIYSWFALDVIAVMLEKRQQKNLATTRNLNFTPLYGIMFFRYQLSLKWKLRKENVNTLASISFPYRHTYMKLPALMYY